MLFWIGFIITFLILFIQGLEIAYRCVEPDDFITWAAFLISSVPPWALLASFFGYFMGAALELSFS